MSTLHTWGQTSGSAASSDKCPPRSQFLQSLVLFRPWRAEGGAWRGIADNDSKGGSRCLLEAFSTERVQTETHHFCLNEVLPSFSLIFILFILNQGKLLDFGHEMSMRIGGVCIGYGLLWCSFRDRRPVGLPYTGCSDPASLFRARQVIFPGFLHVEGSAAVSLTRIQQAVFLGPWQRIGKLLPLMG